MLINKIRKHCSRLVEKFQRYKDKNDSEFTQGYMEGCIDTLKNLELAISFFEKETASPQLFTYDQMDFICYQIGEWYLKWKHCICDYEQKTHRLGFAKEQLKVMICGDNN